MTNGFFENWLENSRADIKSVQRKLEIKEGDLGRGVFVKEGESIPADTSLGFYVGKYCLDSPASRYSFEFGTNLLGQKVSLDATNEESNFTAIINSSYFSEDPNVVCTWLRSKEGLLVPCFMSPNGRSIKSGEELRWNYPIQSRPAADGELLA